MAASNKIIDYFRLMRFHTAAATATPLLIAASLMDQKDLFLLLIIFIIGILSHIYGFVLNEYGDLEVDKKAGYLKEKPLVSGSITSRKALILAITALVIAFCLTIVFFPKPLTILFLLISFLLSGIYDIYGKRITGSDFILAGSFIFYCLFGASTVSTNFTNIVYLLCGLSFLNIAFSNAVSGGLKDVDHDYLGGARTLATIMDVKVEDDKLHITKKFAAFACIILVLYAILLVLTSLQPDVNIWFSDQIIVQISILFLIFLLFFIFYKIFTMKNFDRSKLKRLIFLHGYATYVVVPIILIKILGLYVVIVLIFLPAIWFLVTNLILWKNLIEPRI